MEALKTPLYDEHVLLGGKIVEFAGYLLPVQYPTGVIKEHLAVRNACGLFDVSHMGEITVKGPDSVRYLNHLLTVLSERFAADPKASIDDLMPWNQEIQRAFLPNSSDADH